MNNLKNKVGIKKTRCMLKKKSLVFFIVGDSRCLLIKKDKRYLSTEEIKRIKNENV